MKESIETFFRLLLCLKLKRSKNLLKRPEYHDYEKYAPHRRVVYAFSAFGVVNGLFIATVSLWIMNQLSFFQQQSDDNFWVAHDILDQLVSWSAKFKLLAILGFIILLASIGGLVAAYLGRFIPMLIYFMYVAVGTIFSGSVITVIFVVAFTDSNHNLTSFKNGELRRMAQNRAVAVWTTFSHAKNRMLNSTLTSYVETKYTCCGWYNALDYCEPEHISTIMGAVMNDENFGSYFKDKPDSDYDMRINLPIDYTGIIFGGYDDYSESSDDFSTTKSPVGPFKIDDSSESENPYADFDFVMPVQHESESSKSSESSDSYLVIESVPDYSHSSNYDYPNYTSTNTNLTDYEYDSETEDSNYYADFNHIINVRSVLTATPRVAAPEEIDLWSDSDLDENLEDLYEYYLNLEKDHRRRKRSLWRLSDEELAMQDMECIDKYLDGDESCICDFLVASEITPLAEHMVCAGREENEVYVNDMCQNAEACWLNGCGDIMMELFWAYVMPVFGVFFCLSVICYFYGVVYTFRLTCEYYQMSEKRSLPKVRHQSAKNYVKKHKERLLSYILCLPRRNQGEYTVGKVEAVELDPSHAYNT